VRTSPHSFCSPAGLDGNHLIAGILFDNIFTVIVLQRFSWYWGVLTAVFASRCTRYLWNHPLCDNHFHDARFFPTRALNDTRGTCRVLLGEHFDCRAPGKGI
jgi:hypothetical protein